MAKKKMHIFRKRAPNWGKTSLAKRRMAWALWRIRRKKRAAPDMGQGLLYTFDSTIITFDSTSHTMDHKR